MLEYWVYRENINNKSIEPYNIFKNSNVFNDISKSLKSYKKHQDLNVFKEEIKKSLMYNFWSKSEYEVVVTSWPPFTEVENIDKLKQEVEDYNNKWGHKQIKINVPLTIAEKIDIYDQIMLNFDVFIKYILDNDKEFKNKC